MEAGRTMLIFSTKSRPKSNDNSDKRLLMLCQSLCDSNIFMAARWYRASHYIFALWFLYSSIYLSYLSFFLA